MFRKMDFLENSQSNCKATKITSLNTDCMENIFERLDINDLVNVADSNREFYIAVREVYRRKYLNSNLIFDIKREYFFSYLRNQAAETDALKKNPEILISNPLIALKILRNFGHMIKNLGIDFRYLNAKVCIEIENYLARYCSDSLQRLSLVCSTLKIHFKGLRKPFKNVSALKIHAARDQIENQIRFLNESNLPNVKHIYICGEGTPSYDYGKKIHFENIEYFTLLWPNTKFPFSFGNLKHFITGGYLLELNDAFCECIGRIDHLETLKIMMMRRFSTNSDAFRKMLELQNVQTNVMELQFKYDRRMCPNDIVRFFKQNRKLRKLSIHEAKIEDDYRYISPALEMISSKLGVEWKMHIIHPYRNPFDTLFEHKCYVFERIID